MSEVKAPAVHHCDELDAEIERLRQALTLITRLVSAGQAGEIASAALEARPLGEPSNLPRACETLRSALSFEKRRHAITKRELTKVVVATGDPAALELGTLVDVFCADGTILRTHTRTEPHQHGDGSWNVFVNGLSCSFPIERVRAVRR